MATKSSKARAGHRPARSVPSRGFDVFVSMPFSHEFDNVFTRGVLASSEHLPLYQLNWVRLDREAYKQRLIEQNVLKHINSADLLVADISRYQNQGTANVSVMHEIGYACGRGVPFILIGKSGTHKSLPSNLKGSIVTEYSSDNEVALKEFARKLALQIDKTIQEEVQHGPHGGFRVEGFTERGKLSLPSVIERAEHRINILTTNLNYTDIHLAKSILRALERNKQNPNFRVEILAMDPESDVANARAVQLGKPSVRQYRDELRKSLDNVRKTLEKHDNVEIITYRSLPTQMTFIIDSTVIVAVVSLGQQSRDGIHFVLSDVNTSAAPFLNHFILLKNSAAVQV
jgi:hypothetical protein